MKFNVDNTTVDLPDQINTKELLNMLTTRVEMHERKIARYDDRLDNMSEEDPKRESIERRSGHRLQRKYEAETILDMIIEKYMTEITIRRDK